MKIKKIFLGLAIFGFLAVAASALAINSKTHLSLAFDPTASVTSASPSINSTITPQGVLTNQQTLFSTGTPIANGVVELWDVTANKPITPATTNNDGKYQAVLKIVCNNSFKMEARFAGTLDYLPETSNQVTITPTGGSPCNPGQDPWLVTSTTPPTATSSSGNYIPLVEIPGVDTGNFLNYLRDIYNFLISVVGILAMAALVYGGFRYLTSVGNPAAVEDAKDIINSAVIGLVLALGSWLILNEINPDILVLKKPGQIGALPGKYAYNQTSTACTQSPDPNVALGNECTCADGQKVTTTAVVGPLVIATTPTPCATGISTALPYSITIKFSEPMDAGTAGLVSIAPAVANTPSMPDSATVRLDLTVALAPNTEYTVTVPVTVTSASGVPVPANYVFKFTTGAPPYVCTTPPSGSFCNRVCSDPSLADDGKNHCGAKFLKVKLDTTVTGNDYNFYYLDPKNSEMWRFFLTNDGTIEDFNVNVSSYTAGGITYDCAILLTDENTTSPDIDKVIWVKTGAIISSTSGNSLEKDIGKDNYNDTCPGDQVPVGNSACQLDSGIFDSIAFPGFTAYDLTKASDSSPRGAIKLFKSKYGPTLDYCVKDDYGDCSFAKSRVEYYPSKSIICDPNIKAWRSL